MFLTQTSRAALVASLLLAVPAGVAPTAAFAQEFRFNEVRVEGAQRVDPASVIAFAGIERGETLTAGQLNAAYQRIVNSGLFETVEITPRGSVLQITVQEWPTVNRINIEGNRRIEDEPLLEAIQSQSRRVYNPAQAEADAARIADLYAQRGRLAASVEPRIIRRSDNRVDLVFEVIEGRVVEIERISFLGNRNFSERRLRNVLQTSQAGLFRTFIQSDTFIEERIAFDRQVLTDFYNSRGYVDFQVLSVSSELTRQRDGVFLTFNVREGQSFNVGTVGTSSTVDGVDAAEFEAALRIRPGETYSPALIENNIARLERLAVQKQLNFIRISPRITRNEAAGTLDVDFVIERGPRVFVERIDIEGNATTLDRVIRRQFNSVEGDPFNPREIRQAAERIRALGFFSDSTVESRRGSADDRVIVDVNVEEAPTGSLSFGGTYSVQSGIGLSINLSERNFLGRGQGLSFSYAGGVDNRSTTLSFSEPAFLDRNVRFTFDFSFLTTDNASATFDTEVVDATVGLEFPVSENGRLGFRAGFGQAKIFDINPAVTTPILVREQGTRETHKIGYTYSYDSRRSGLDPDSGVLLRFGQDITGLGSNDQILRTSALAAAETRWMNSDLALKVELEGGMLTPIGGATTRATDRFFPGGAVFRGFQSSGVGPRDLGTNDALGGNYFAVARFESQFPLGLPDDYNINGGLFMDVGSVWGLQDRVGQGGAIVDDSARLRATVGFAVYWTTAIGPLRFNFTQPLQVESYDRTASFDLTISTNF